MNEDDIKRAISNQTLFLIAGLEGEGRYVALTERLHQLAGMLELALLMQATPTLIRFLTREREYVSLRREEVM